MVVTMKLPVVSSGTLDATTASINDPDWVENLYQRVRKDNPIIAEYCFAVKLTHGEHAGLTGMLVYRFLESQLEAEEML